MPDSPARPGPSVKRSRSAARAGEGHPEPKRARRHSNDRTPTQSKMGPGVWLLEERVKKAEADEKALTERRRHFLRRHFLSNDFQEIDEDRDNIYCVVSLSWVTKFLAFEGVGNEFPRSRPNLSGPEPGPVTNKDAAGNVSGRFAPFSGRMWQGWCYLFGCDSALPRRCSCQRPPASEVPGVLGHKSCVGLSLDAAPAFENFDVLVQLARDYPDLSAENFDKVAKRAATAREALAAERKRAADQVECSEAKAKALVCVVCFEKPRGALFRDCGHLSVCGSCAEKLDTCPMCMKKGPTIKAYW